MCLVWLHDVRLEPISYVLLWLPVLLMLELFLLTDSIIPGFILLLLQNLISYVVAIALILERFVIIQHNPTKISLFVCLPCIACDRQMRQSLL